jgi:hypothetical protein
MSSKQEHPIQAMGFWMFGFLSVVLAVLKLTVAGYWSWWGHNAVYLLAGFLCFCWLKHEGGEEEPTTVQKHSREGYNLAALLFFFLFLDNLLRRVEGQGWKGFWPCSGRFEVVVLFGMLSLVAQLVYWSRIVRDPLGGYGVKQDFASHLGTGRCVAVSTRVGCSYGTLSQ